MQTITIKDVEVLPNVLVVTIAAIYKMAVLKM